MPLKPYKVPGPFKSGTHRAVRGAKTAFHNKTSKPGVGAPESHRREAGNPEMNTSALGNHDFHEMDNETAGAYRAGVKSMQHLGGFAVGAAAGGAGGAAYHAHRRKPLKQELKQSAGFTKAAYRITNLGTTAGRLADHATNRSYSPWDAKPFALGAGVGVGAGALNSKLADNQKRAKIKTAIRRNNKKNSVAKMDDPFNIYKRDERKGPGVIGGLGAATGGAVLGAHAGGLAASGGSVPKYKRNLANAKAASGSAGAAYTAEHYGKESPGKLFRGAYKAGQAGVKAAGHGGLMHASNAGSLLGAAGGTGLYVAHKKKQQKLYGGPVEKSAFGVEHGEFSKAAALDPNTHKPGSTGRYATAGAFGGIHGAVAGKPGKKLRSFGNEAGGAFLGSTAGAIAGSALTGGNPSAGRAVGLAAGATGGIMGARRNQRKGYLKPQP